MLFTPTLLILMPALSAGFPRLEMNQAIALGLIVEFAGYSSAALAYWRQGRVALEVARPLLLLTVPSAVILSWVGSLVPERWLLVAFGLVLFVLATLFLRHPPHPAGCPC